MSCHAIWQHADRWRRQNPKRLLLFSSLMLSSGLLFVLFIVYRQSIFEWIQFWHEQVKLSTERFWILWTLQTFLLIVACFPPVIGYSLILTSSGFWFGWLRGFLLNWTGSVLGSCFCFAIFRYGCRRQQGTSMRYRHLDPRSSSPTRATLQAEERVRDPVQEFLDAMRLYMLRNPRDKFSTLLLLRLAPYPFTYGNLILAQLPAVELRDFMLVTSISLLKTVWHAWLGSQLESIEDLNDIKKINWWELVLVIVVGLVGVGFGWIIFRKIQAMIQRDESVEMTGLRVDDNTAPAINSSE